MIEVSAAVVDTDVFSHVYLRPGSKDYRLPGWRDYLTGRRVMVSFQTRAEVLVGARSNNWGERRLAETISLLDRMPTIRADNDVVAAYAALTAECRRIGHALQASHHTGDRWIAACAIAKNLALLAGDQIYRDAPNLVLVGEVQ